MLPKILMEQKGLVHHRRIGKAYAYSAVVHRDRTCQTLATEFLHRVFDGAVDEYLVHVLDSRRPSLEELNQLEKMIAQAKDGLEDKPEQETQR